MGKRVAVIGDVTTTGGVIITGSSRGFCGNKGIALLGDIATCPKCKKSGKIIEAAHNLVFDGRPAAYDGCIIACGCSPVGSNKIIATKSHMYVDVPSNYNKVFMQDSSVQTQSMGNNILPNNDNTHSVGIWNKMNLVPNNDKSRIRIDAQELVDCANEVCEKHLYHDDIKNVFIQDVESFATEIVHQVDHGELSYEDGSKKIKDEEKSLGEQSVEWVVRGLSVLGGIGLMMTGVAMCTTGIGCIIGRYIAAHGANSIQEG